MEIQEFYTECLKSCSKEIVKIHETNQLQSLENNQSHSYLLELLRKKWVEEKTSTGVPKYDELKAGRQYNTIDRHMKTLIYRTIKNIGISAKEEQKRANLLNVSIEWLEFQKFTPLQVIGLMLLRDDVSTKLKKVLFHPYTQFYKAQ